MNELEKENARLKQDNINLKAALASKDRLLKEMLESINLQLDVAVTDAKKGIIEVTGVLMPTETIKQDKVYGRHHCVNANCQDWFCRCTIGKINKFGEFGHNNNDVRYCSLCNTYNPDEKDKK